MAKALIGKVTSDKPEKTIVVSVESRRTHPIYKKQYTRSQKIMVHDPNNDAKTGDLVSVVESRPISAKKRYKLENIIEKAVIRHEEKEETL